MRKLITVVAILALCTTGALADNIQENTNTIVKADDDPATATFEVGLSVAKYAEVTWNNPTQDYLDRGAAVVTDPNIALTGPVGRVFGVNYLEVPIRLRSNCDVTLTLAEGVSAALTAPAVGVPASAIYDGDNWGDHVYEVINAMGDPNQAFEDEVFGREWMGNNDYGLGGVAGYNYSKNSLHELPGSSDEGLTTTRTFIYGAPIFDIGGTDTHGAGDYTGDFETHVKMGVHLWNETSGDDWSWTELEAGTEIDDALYYATISVNNG